MCIGYIVNEPDGRPDGCMGCEGDEARDYLQCYMIRVLLGWPIWVACMYICRSVQNRDDETESGTKANIAARWFRQSHGDDKGRKERKMPRKSPCAGGNSWTADVDYHGRPMSTTDALRLLQNGQTAPSASGYRGEGREGGKDATHW